MDIFRRPVSGINDPVYTTPNSPSLSSSSPSSSSPSSALRSSRSPQASSSSSTPKTVSFATPSTQLVTSPPPLNLNLGDVDWANIVAVAQTITPSIFNVPSNPVDISHRLMELHKKEEEIVSRRKNLEDELAQIRSDRSQLILQLEKVLSPELSFSSNSLTAPPSTTVPTVRPRESSTIIEELDPEPAQPRSSDTNASMTSLTKKRPGPASKTGLSGLKVINPGSLPPLGPTPNSSKKSQKGGNDSPKRPVTTGVKQSRPQPMRARKRNKPEESGSSTVPQSQNNPEIDQANKESQPKPQAPASAPEPVPQPQPQPQPPQQPSQPQAKPSTTQKSQMPIVKNPVVKDQVKIEPKSEEKPRIPSQAALKKNDPLKPSPFKERAETNSNSESEPLKRKIKQEPVTKPKKTDVNVAIAKDEDADTARSNPVQGDDKNDEDDAHSDSEIFNALKSVQQSSSSNGNTSTEIGAKKIKKESEQPSNLVTPKVEPQEAARREPNIKQEK